MKRLLSAITLLLAFTAAWADSPLTSTHFANAYEDHPMVQMVNEDMQSDLPTVLLNFLADKKSPVDVRLNEAKLVKKLDAGTLAVYAYAKAMSNYFDVTAASEMGHLAVKKNKGKSLSVALISALIDAQVYLDSDWSKIYPVVSKVLHDGSLRLDMRQEAINGIMEYINLYKEYE